MWSVIVNEFHSYCRLYLNGLLVISGIVCYRPHDCQSLRIAHVLGIAEPHQLVDEIKASDRRASLVFRIVLLRVRIKQDGESARSTHTDEILIAVGLTPRLDTVSIRHKLLVATSLVVE